MSHIFDEVEQQLKPRRRAPRLVLYIGVAIVASIVALIAVYSILTPGQFSYRQEGFVPVIRDNKTGCEYIGQYHTLRQGSCN